jgi:hypothetical protein
VSNVLEVPTDRQLTDSEWAELHCRAFRNLEPAICDCTSMAKLAAQMMFAADDGSNRELIFAVAHVSELLTTLKADYYAARRGERQGDRL